MRIIAVIFSVCVMAATAWGNLYTSVVYRVKPEQALALELNDLVIERGALVVNVNDMTDVRVGDGVTPGGFRIGTPQPQSSDFSGQNLVWGEGYSSRAVVGGWRIEENGDPLVLLSRGGSLNASITSFSITGSTLRLSTLWDNTPATNLNIQWSADAFTWTAITNGITIAATGFAAEVTAPLPTGSVAFVALAFGGSTQPVLRVLADFQPTSITLGDTTITDWSQVSGSLTGLSAEASARIGADAALSSSVASVTANLGTASNALNLAITNDRATRISADAALSSSVASVTADLGTASNALNLAITNDRAARVAADAALSNAVGTAASNASTAIGWGNHATQNYMTVTTANGSFLPKTNLTLSAGNTSAPGFTGRLRLYNEVLASWFGFAPYGGAGVPPSMAYEASEGSPTDVMLTRKIGTNIWFDGRINIGGVSPWGSGSAPGAIYLYDAGNALLVSITTTGGLKVGAASFESDLNGNIRQDATNSANLGAITAQTYRVAGGAIPWQAEIDSIVSLSAGVAAVTANLGTASNSLNLAITNDRAARIAADAALSSSVASVTADLGTASNALNLAVTNDRAARIAADAALSSSVANVTANLNTQSNTLNLAITNDRAARIAADAALSSSVAAVTADLGTASNHFGALVLGTSNTLWEAYTNEVALRAAADAALSNALATLDAFAVAVSNLTTNINARLLRGYSSDAFMMESTWQGFQTNLVRFVDPPLSNNAAGANGWRASEWRNGTNFLYDWLPNAFSTNTPGWIRTPPGSVSWTN